MRYKLHVLHNVEFSAFCLSAATMMLNLSAGSMACTLL